MKIQQATDVESREVTMEGAAGCSVRWLVDDKDGAPNFAMRQFDVAPGGHTPRHSHPYEHEIYVLEGAGEVIEGDQARPLKAGDVVYVAPDDILRAVARLNQTRRITIHCVSLGRESQLLQQLAEAHGGRYVRR